MRVIVFFDLPTETKKHIREYTRFRKHLLSNGFIMMQESVYSKLVLNLTGANAVCEGIRRNKPEEGLIQILTITERQFANIEYVLGDVQNGILDSPERFVVL